MSKYATGVKRSPIRLDKGSLFPFEHKSCRNCGHVSTNTSAGFVDAGVFARWHTSDGYTTGRGEMRFKEFSVWTCSADCAYELQESHENMTLLAEVEL